MSLFEEINKEKSKVIVGQDRVISRIITCLFSEGHILIVGVPGLAKTLMANVVARMLDLEFRRIQFTPDLMPADIIGFDIIEEDLESGKKKLVFQKGPVFTNILLADEINRASPKTQSALLEAMQERKVTVFGRTYELENPFFVIATQNPLEQEGTYPLPEAQLDRFMMQVIVDYPSLEEEWRRLRKEVIREVEDLFVHISPGAQVVAYSSRRNPFFIPERVVKFYQALDMALGTVKQSVMELLKEGKKDEARSKLKDIAIRMFSNSFMVMFPTIAIASSSRRVHLDVKTFAGLSKLCDIVGIRIPFKLEWRVNELLELLDEICKRREDWVTRDWVEILRNIIEYRLHDAIYTI